MGLAMRGGVEGRGLLTLEASTPGFLCAVVTFQGHDVAQMHLTKLCGRESCVLKGFHCISKVRESKSLREKALRIRGF